MLIVAFDDDDIDENDMTSAFITRQHVNTISPTQSICAPIVFFDGHTAKY